jgi:cytoskeletal protein RodZ
MKNKWNSLSLAGKIIILSVTLVLLYGGALIAVSPFFVYEKPNQTDTVETQPTTEKTNSVFNTAAPQNVSTESTSPSNKKSAISQGAISQPAQPTAIEPVRAAPKVDRSAYIAACENLKQSQEVSYQANVNAENVNSQSNIANIQSDYRSRGLGFSGLMQEAINQENQRHQFALSSLEVTYQQQMSQECK